ncbi:winged helix-turn-helix domain-containing protein [Enterococcus caccae]|uniref:OmpR/PhoB-type domain-containing protein n=1 Tax=Enterococcus caccae ATCC BAA-1240 TaxID=1158612 RepID=R3U5T5_9ENTE|nr:winged helix-turn-helix domain-containing protein [Enterococcus caccae]EOL49309.1 hypothetical protein UC7_00686 [Enterococcus caccae ATCC BAA-1240]EOT56361.1 hypothetical protein I580_03161 [Enterococcus caccae ATCC BAA-1240]OJG24304.1 hypothetical protein RU98_GL001727 [Enterococcus caccae]
MYALGILSDKQTIQKNEQERLFTDFDIQIYDLENVDLTTLQGIVLHKNEHIQIEKLFQWLIKFRENPIKPIWILTDEPLGKEKVIYLKLGVIGFLLESDSFDEIAWTIKNGLSCMTIGQNHSFCLEPSSLAVQIANKKITLTRLEYSLLDYLYASENKVRTYEEIAKYLWSKEKLVPKYRVANLVFHIRQKIKMVHPKYVDMIKTVHSKGYSLNLSEQTNK